MPLTTYTEDEVAQLLRVAYATGVRDTIVGIQGATLTEEQAALLAPLARDPWRLRETEKHIHRVAFDATLGQALAALKIRARGQ